MVALLTGWSPSESPGQEPVPPEAARRPLDASPKVMRYCQRVLEQLGAENDRALPLELWPAGHGDAASWDTDGNGDLSASELAARVEEYARNRSLRMLAAPPPSSAGTDSAARSTGDRAGVEGESPSRETQASESPELPNLPAGPRVPVPSPPEAIYQVAPSRLAAGVPPWLIERDQDGDGQLTLSEFAPEPTGGAIREFRRLDWNNDGVITLKEARRGPQSDEGP